MRIAVSVFAGLLGSASLGACAHEVAGRDCAGKTREQCRWQQATTTPPDQAGVGPTDDPRQAGRGWESEGSWSRSQGMLQQAADWLSEGLGGAVLSEQARTWCETDPTLIDKGHGPSWVCAVENPPRIGGRSFSLEAADRGVLALAAGDFSGPESQRVVNQAMKRWQSWCGDSRFVAIERFQQEEFHSCALPGGPLLVVGRFPQDLEADLWQVSLTVMGPG